VAPSYLSTRSTFAASAAEVVAQRKQDKYTEMACNYHFFSIDFKTFGPINHVGTDFISDLGHCISSITDDPRETFSLLYRLSVAIQWFNAVCFVNSFGNIDVEVRSSQPRHT